MNQSLSLILTNQCNLSCQGCYNNPSNYSSEIDPEKLKFFILSFRPTFVKLLGGEPTLSTNIVDVCSFLNQEQIPFSLITNGLKLFEADFIKQIRPFFNKKNNIIISLWQNDFVLKHYVDLHNNLTDLNFSFSLVIDSNDHDKYTDIIDTITKKHLKKIVLNAFVSPVNSSSLTEQGKCISEEPSPPNPLSQNLLSSSVDQTLRERGDCQKHVEDTNKKLMECFVKNQNVIFNVSKIRLCDFETNLLLQMKKENRLATGCSLVMGGGMAINPEGDFLPCSHFNGLSSFSAFEEPEKIEPYQKKLVESFSRYPQEECKSCDKYKLFCWGGCPIWRGNLDD